MQPCQENAILFEFTRKRYSRAEQLAVQTQGAMSLHAVCLCIVCECVCVCVSGGVCVYGNIASSLTSCQLGGCVCFLF